MRCAGKRSFRIKGVARALSATASGPSEPWARALGRDGSRRLARVASADSGPVRQVPPRACAQGSDRGGGASAPTRLHRPCGQQRPPLIVTQRRYPQAAALPSAARLSSSPGGRMISARDFESLVNGPHFVAVPRPEGGRRSTMPSEHSCASTRDRSTGPWLAGGSREGMAWTGHRPLAET